MYNFIVLHQETITNILIAFTTLLWIYFWLYWLAYKAAYRGSHDAWIDTVKELTKDVKSE